MNYHAEDKEQEDGRIMTQYVEYLRKVPMRTYLVHHLAGSVPGHFIGFSRVKVGSRAEEEAGEGDEDKGNGDGPGS